MGTLVYGHKLINSIWNKKELPEEWKEPIILPTKQTAVIIEAYHFCQMHTKLNPGPFCQN
jgi:hypothetical protein